MDVLSSRAGKLLPNRFVEKNRTKHNYDGLADENLYRARGEPTPGPRNLSRKENVGHGSRIDEKQIVYDGQNYQTDI